MTAITDELADRVRWHLAMTEHDVVERKMFGGTCFMVNEKMCLGVRGDELMCRLGPEDYAKAVETNDCRPMIHGGKPMTGFVFIGPDSTRSVSALGNWISLALAFNRIAKPARRRRPAPKHKEPRDLLV